MIDKIIAAGKRHGIEVERRQAKQWVEGKSPLSRLLCAVVGELESEDDFGIKKVAPTALGPDMLPRPVPPIFYDSTPKVGGDGKREFPTMSVEEAKKGLSPGALAEIERQEAKHGPKSLLESAEELESIEDISDSIFDTDPPDWGKLASDVAEPEEYDVAYVGDAPGVRDGWKKVGTVISVCVDEVAYSVGGVGVVEIGGDRWLMADGGRLEKQ